MTVEIWCKEVVKSCSVVKSHQIFWEALAEMTENVSSAEVKRTPALTQEHCQPVSGWSRLCVIIW